MTKQLRPGDVFYLQQDTNVRYDVVDKENTYMNASVGKIYESKTNFDDDRYPLKSAIAAKLSSRGVVADWDIVSRFVEYVAKNKPANRFCIMPGEFIVTHVVASEGTNNETVHCRRFRPTSYQDTNRIHFLQNHWGAGDSFQKVLFRVKFARPRPVPLPPTSSLQNIEVRIIPPFQLIVRTRNKLMQGG
jgi:hypothetical protein